MERVEVDRDARRFLILVGGTIEQLVLSRAREMAVGERRSVGVRDVERSLETLVESEPSRLVESLREIAIREDRRREAG